ARARVRQTSAASLFRRVAEFGPFQETASGPHQSLCLAELLQQLRVGAAAERPMSPPRDCECPPDPGQGRRADHDCDSDHYLQAQRESYEFAGTPQDTLRQPPQAEHDQQHGQCDDGVDSAYRCRGCEPAGRWRWFPQVAIHTSLCHWSRCRAATTIPDAVHRRDKNWFFGNFREASHGSRRDRQAEYYAHEDADSAGHNGQSTDKKGSSGIRGKRSVERPTKADERL